MDVASPATTTTGRRRSGRPKLNSYVDLMKPGESWDDLDDATERRKIQNRLAQRAYRETPHILCNPLIPC